MKFSIQTVVIGIFGVGFVIGMLIFSGIVPVGSGGSQEEALGGAVTIWGTVGYGAMGEYINIIDAQYKNVDIQYIQKDLATFDDELLRALAEGSGPDLFFLTQDHIVEHRNKLYIIPYANYPAETFQSQFVDGAGIFLDPEGVLAFPFLVDPLVMYYNRDILSSSFVVNTPQYWDDLFTFAPQVSSQTDSGIIVQSAVALGSFGNIVNAKDVMSLIMLQSGNKLVERSSDGALYSVFRTGGVLDSALRFVTVFSNPSQEAYSWNASLPSSRDMFVSGDLALYFGYASELSELRRLNPNLNFDVAFMPQLREQQLRATFGNFTGIGISKSSANPVAAFSVANTLASPAISGGLAEKLFLPPIHRSLLAVKPDEAYKNIFYNSAISARSWLDPDTQATDILFKEMIDDTVAGRLRSNEVLDRFNAKLTQLFP